MEQNIEINKKDESIPQFKQRKNTIFGNTWK